MEKLTTLLEKQQQGEYNVTIDELIDELIKEEFVGEDNVTRPDGEGDSGYLEKDGHVFELKEEGNGDITVEYVGEKDSMMPTIEVAKGTSGATSKVVIRVTGKEPISGIASIEEVGEDKREYSELTKKKTEEFEIIKNGTYTFRVTSNLGKSVEETIEITDADNEAPSGSYTLSPEAGTWGQSVIITVTGHDNIGIKQITRPDLVPEKKDQVQFEATENKTYNFIIEDTAGHQTTLQVPVENVDRVGPSGSHTLSPEAGTYGQTVTINVKATDNQSGTETGKAKIIKPDKKEQTGGTCTYEVEANDTYTFTLVDAVGNETEYPVTVENIDRERPTATHTISPEEGTYAQKVKITIEAQDEISGIAKITKPDNSYVEADTCTYEVEANNTYTFTIEDKAGNKLEYPVKVENVDKELPTASHTLKPEAGDWGRTVTITVEANDNRGIKKITLPDERVEEGKTTVSYTVNENNTYNFIIEDVAGNTITYPVEVKNVDTEVPTAKYELTPEEGTIADKVTIKVTASDNAGIKEITLPDGNTTAENPCTYEATENKTYIFKIKDVTDHEITLEVPVKNVTIQVASVTLDSENLSMYVGDTQELHAEVQPEDATHKEVTWDSTRKEVAKVEGGRITALGEGQTEITASAGGVSSKSCTVTVSKRDNPIQAKEAQSWEAIYKTEAQTKEIEGVTKAEGEVTYTITEQKKGEAKVEQFKLNGTTLSMNANTEVGTYIVTIKAEAAGNNNYKPGSKTIVVTVNVGQADNPMAVTDKQTWAPTYKTTAQETQIEGAANAEGEATYTITEQKKGEAKVEQFTLKGTTLSMNANTEVGTYTITINAAAAGNNNYKPGSKTIVVTVTVGQADNTMTVKDKQTWAPTYKTTAQETQIEGAANAVGEVTYTITEQKKGEAKVEQFKLNGTKLSMNANTEVGTYTITINVAAAGNNNYKPGSKTITMTVTVGQADMAVPTVSIDTEGKVKWNGVEGATGYEISFNESNWDKAESGARTISTETKGSKTAYVRATSTNKNYKTPSVAGKATVEVYNLALNKGTGINGTTGGGNYVKGKKVSISAEVKTGYTWQGWTKESGTAPEEAGKQATAVTIGEDTVLKANATANALNFEDQSQSVTFNTSDQNITITGASNGTGAYTYTESSEATAAGQKTDYISINGLTITIKGSTPAGTYKYVVTATDNDSRATKNATITITVGKANNTMTVTESQTWETTFKTTEQTHEVTPAKDVQGEVTYKITEQKKDNVVVNQFSLNGTTLSMNANTGVGTYVVKIEVKTVGNVNYNGSTKTITMTVTVGQADNTITVTDKQTWTPTFSTDAQTHTIEGAKNAVGEVTYTISSQVNSAGNVNYFEISGTNLSMKGNTPGGSYTVTIKAEAKGNTNYKLGSKNITVTVTVGQANNTMTVSETQSWAATYSTADQNKGLGIANAQGEVTCKITEQKKDNVVVNQFKISGTNLVMNGGTGAGTYTVKISVEAKGNTNYKSLTKTITMTVTVKVPVSSVTISPASVTMYIGGNKTITQKLTADVQPTNATNKTVTWNSNATGIATVDGGTVTPKGAGGAKITATADGVSGTSNITVIADNAGPTGNHELNPPLGTKGEKVTITVTATDAGVGVEKIIKPNSAGEVPGDTCTYEVTENGEYTFKLVDRLGNVTNYIVPVNNAHPLHNVTITQDNYKDYLGKVVTNFSSKAPGSTDTVNGKTVGTTYRLYYVDFGNKYQDGAGTIYLKADGNGKEYSLSESDTTAVDSTKMKQLNPELYKNNNAPSESNYNMKAVKWLLNPANWNSLKTNSPISASVNYVVGAPSLEMMMDSYNEYYNLKGITSPQTGDIPVGGGRIRLFYRYTSGNWGYEVGPQGYFQWHIRSTTANSVQTDPEIDDMYYPGDGGDYWLASPSAASNGAVSMILAKQNCVYNLGDLMQCVLCPLVSLKSSVKLEFTE